MRLRECTSWNSRLALAAGVAFLTFLQSACASRSVGEPPLLQETLTVQCEYPFIKECRVWGGNKFRKRYEYCGCRDHRN